MSEQALAVKDEISALRDLILQNPDVILDDRDIMQKLVSAGTIEDGRNVVDLRGRLVDRLEDRLDDLQETHRSVVAAAYENLAGTNQIHRAVLALLEAEDFATFLRVLNDDAPNILSVDMIRIALETPANAAGQSLGPKGKMSDLILSLPPGGVDVYMGGRGQDTAVVLRACTEATELLFEEEGAGLRSEAVMKLDLGEGRRPGILVLGSEDPYKFHPDQAADLLNFLSGTFERMMRRWLA